MYSRSLFRAVFQLTFTALLMFLSFAIIMNGVTAFKETNRGGWISIAVPYYAIHYHLTLPQFVSS